MSLVSFWGLTASLAFLGEALGSLRLPWAPKVTPRRVPMVTKVTPEGSKMRLK